MKTLHPDADNIPDDKLEEVYNQVENGDGVVEFDDFLRAFHSLKEVQKAAGNPSGSQVVIQKPPTKAHTYNRILDLVDDLA